MSVADTPTLAGKGVTALRRSGKIGDAEVLAAERWLRDYTLGVHGYFDSEPGRASGGGDAHTAGFARAKAADAYRSAAQAVGRFGDSVLRELIAADHSIRGMAAYLNLSVDVTCGIVMATMLRLSDHYATDSEVIIGEASGEIRSASFI